MELQTLTPQAALQALLTTGDGLPDSEVAGRLAQYGPNEIKRVKKTPLYLRFLSQFTHFLAPLLWAAAGLCVISEWLHPGTGRLCGRHEFHGAKQHRGILCRVWQRKRARARQVAPHDGARPRRSALLRQAFAGAHRAPPARVPTPGAATIEQVTKFLKCKPQQMIKTLIYVGDGKPLAVGSVSNQPSFMRTRQVAALDQDGWAQLATQHTQIAGAADPAEIVLRLSVKDPDRKKVERFGREIAPLVTAGPAGVTGFAGGRPKAQEIVAYWPALLPRELVDWKVSVEAI